MTTVSGRAERLTPGSAAEHFAGPDGPVSGARPTAERHERQQTGAGNGDAGPTGYLRYRMPHPVPTGMNHQLRNLQCLLREAHALGRLAVLPPLRLNRVHNHGVARDWCWDDYFDLQASRLVEADGTERALPVVRALPAGLRPTLHVARHCRVPRRALAGGLVERRVVDSVHAREVKLGRGPGPTLRMVPSARVLAFAASVADALGEHGGGAFAAVHVRRGDWLVGAMRWVTRPASVARVLRRLGVAPGSTVYACSDEGDPAYWAELALDFDIVRYASFPTLAGLVPPLADAPDNYLLYEVEKAVMRRAAVRVETFPTGVCEAVDGFLVPPWLWAGWLGYWKIRPGLVVRLWWRRRWRLLVALAFRYGPRLLGDGGWTALRKGRRALRARFTSGRRAR